MTKKAQTKKTTAPKKKYFMTWTNQRNGDFDELFIEELFPSIAAAKKHAEENVENGDTFYIYEATRLTQSAKVTSLSWVKGENK